MNYSFGKTLTKGIKVIILAGLSLLIAGIQIQAPQIAGLTILGVLQIVYDFLKHKWGMNLP